ncbi:hypothetical protein HMPREF0027_2023 [Actinobacillus ureae ATCC 25976]|uniref:Transposase n=1 Tax=Actinobacillus ureae ATCC 25976 TaxID=887324 RepID=E8KJK6_9PAST|nr:transposase [Actinobacillus ureae]EFX90984.1 hypothetical protein HMPREF0027_2023 [Actinobacillus ureae ATCC 25976]
MSYSYQFRLEIIKLIIEQGFGIREVAKLHQIFHSLVINWLKAFRERGLEGGKITLPPTSTTEKRKARD